MYLLIKKFDASHSITSNFFIFFFRPLTRSTDASMEKLRCSPSSLGSDEDDWLGFYAKPFLCAAWVYIGDNEELQVWQRTSSKGEFT